MTTETGYIRTRNSHRVRDPIRRMFDRLVPVYELLNHLLSLNIDRYWRFRASRWGNGRVLDLCTGSGEMGQALKRVSPHGIVGLDFSASMLQTAKARRRLRWLIQADAEVLPFRSQTFDTVTCAFGLRNLRHPVRCFQEVYRILKPGGHFVILEMALPHVPFRWVYAVYLTQILPKVGGLVASDTAAYRYLAQSILRFDRKKNTVWEELQRVGFRTVQTVPLVGGTAWVFIAKKET